MTKNTYGTGGFLLMNTGSTPKLSDNRLLSTIGWTIPGATSYALEGSVFVAGAVVQWLREGVGLIDTSAEIESLARQVKDNGGRLFNSGFCRVRRALLGSSCTKDQ